MRISNLVFSVTNGFPSFMEGEAYSKVLVVVTWKMQYRSHKPVVTIMIEK